MAINGVLSLIQYFISGLVPEWPYLNFRHLERVEHTHRNGIGALIRQVSPDSSTNLLFCLPDVDRLLVVVIEQVNSPFAVTNFPIGVSQFCIQYADHSLIQG